MRKSDSLARAFRVVWQVVKPCCRGVRLFQHGPGPFPKTNDARRKVAEYDAAPRDEGEVHEASVVCFEVGSRRRVVWRNVFCWSGGSTCGPAECPRQAEEPGAARDRARGDGRTHR